MNVYLDNNVYVDIEYGELNLLDFTSKSNVKYYFSSEIIDELIEGENVSNLNRDARIELIENICGDNCILPSIDIPEFYTQSPIYFYKNNTNNLFRTLRMLLNNNVSNIKPNHDCILKELSLKRIEMNNISPENIFKHIDSSLRNSSNKISVNEYLKGSEAKGKGVYSTLFNLLDAVCFWKDKNGMEVSRLYDASHAYNAQLCDYFVTNDKRLRYKTEAVYRFLGVDTIVITPNEFINL